MGEEPKEWVTMWGAKVKMPNDMPDDMLKDAIQTVKAQLDSKDFDTEVCMHASNH
jgi:hypothetical protein